MSPLRASHVLAVATGLLGCGGRPGAAAAVAPASTLAVVVTTTAQTNRGNPMYLLVRSSDPKAPPAAESYQDVSARLFASPPDPSVVASEPILPGEPTKLVIDTSTVKALTLYFLFTEPGANWRVPLRGPFPRALTVALDDDQIRTVERR